MYDPDGMIADLTQWERLGAQKVLKAFGKGEDLESVLTQIYYRMASPIYAQPLHAKNLYAYPNAAENLRTPDDVVEQGLELTLHVLTSKATLQTTMREYSRQVYMNVTRQKIVDGKQPVDASQ